MAFRYTYRMLIDETTYSISNKHAGNQFEGFQEGSDFCELKNFKYHPNCDVGSCGNNEYDCGVEPGNLFYYYGITFESEYSKDSKKLDSSFSGHVSLESSMIFALFLERKNSSFTAAGVGYIYQ